MRWLQFAASVTHLEQAFGTSLHEPVMGNFTRSLYSLSVLGIPIFLSTAVAVSAAAAAAGAGATGATILYHNNGDWRTHAQTPSAILVNERASYDEAVGICASYNETLLHCDQLGAFVDEIIYQIWLGNINEWDLLWTSCGGNQPADTKGNMHQSAGKENWEFFKFPFLCTNSAPFVDKVNTDYSTFPRVKTPEVDGVVFEGLRDHMAYRFLGIPFAKPPVDELRFRYAQPVEYGNQKGGAIVDATKYRQACMQVGSLEGNSQGLNPWGNSEDCLHLQVFTPVLPTQEASNGSNLKPVMLWIHGGAMINGAGSDSTFDGDSLVSRGDVVLVSINYRLNIFGLLTLDDGVVNGNYGLSDKIAALQWVKKYIRAFGGDPDNVTIFGQSAGGASVMDLIASPKAKGLFKNAIAQSLVGNVVNQNVIADVMLPYIDPVCPSSAGAEARLQCLRQLPAATLLNISTEYWSWSTVIDGIYMTAQPLSLVANSQVNGVNILMGFMPDEAQSLLATSIAPNMSSLTTGFDALVNGGVINSSQIPQITASGLWDVPQQYTNDYNATVNIGTDGMVICHVSQFIKAAASSSFSSSSSSSSVSSKPFQSLWVYTHHRAYALSFYSFYDLCTFPVGEPDVPYYRCHSGDLYETFGTYYLFNQPVRVDEDIYYTNAVQDIWTSFAGSGNPNPDKKYLEVRDYQSSLRMFEGFAFEEYTSKEEEEASMVANLQWPRPWLSDLRDQTHCQVLGMM